MLFLLRRSFLFALFFIFFISSMVFAQADINEQGFRSLTWGSTVEDFQKSGIEFKLLDFDRNKKLYNYIVINDSLAIYDVGFYPIYYNFWDNKFVAVRAHFNTQQDTGAFQRLYNQLTAEFGIGSLSKNNENITMWTKGETNITLNYVQQERKGYLYISNSKSQEEYAQFLRTKPVMEFKYENEPEGFLNMRWGENIKDLEDKGIKFKNNKNKNRVGDYIIEKDDKKLLGIDILEKTYSFWKDQFFCAYVYYKIDEGKHSFNEIYQKLVDKYGEASNMRFDPNVNAHFFIWLGDKTQIVLYDSLEGKEGYVFFVSPEIYFEWTKAQQEKNL